MGTLGLILIVVLVVLYFKCLNRSYEKLLTSAFDGVEISINGKVYVSEVSNCDSSHITRRATMYFYFTDKNNVADTHQYKLVFELPTNSNKLYSGDITIYHLSGTGIYILVDPIYTSKDDNDVVKHIAHSISR